MLNLILATLFSASFAMVVRYAQGRRCNMWAVGAMNYAVASLSNLALQAAQGDLSATASTAWIGASAGVSYVVAYFVLFKLMALRGIAISTAVTRLSVLIPVVASIVIWREQPTPYQSLGSLLALVSLPLLGIRLSPAGSSVDRRALSYLAALFLLNGYNMLAVRMFKETNVPGESALFLSILFGVAAIVAIAAWCTHRGHTSARDLVPGVALGLVNALANLSVVAALRQLPGFLVFPFHSAVGLAITVIAARLIWREQIGRLETAGIAVTLLAAVLINLG